MQCTPPVAVAEEAGLLDLHRQITEVCDLSTQEVASCACRFQNSQRRHVSTRTADTKVLPPSSKVSRRDTQRDCRRTRGGGTYLWLRSLVLGLGTSVPTPADGMRARNGAAFGYRRISQSAQVEWCDEAVRASRDAACMHTGCDNEAVWPISGRDSGLRRVGGDDRAPTAGHFA